MAKRIVWTEQARADVRGIEQSVALQILKTLARYAQTGEGNTKQLRGIEPTPDPSSCSGSPRVLPRQRRLPGDLPCARSQGGLPLTGYEAKKAEHCGPKRGNGAYWGYR
jgi:hypothetical protein